MRDLHFDGGFMRDFNAASEQWSWATWHQIRAAQEATAQRLLEQVFGSRDDASAPADGIGEAEK
jgi:hypothetical protein